MNPLLPESAHRQALLQQASRHVDALFESMPGWPVAPAVDSATIRRHLADQDFSRPRPDQDVLDQVHDWLRDWGLHVPHPRYFGLFNPTPSFQGILADLLVAAFNVQAGAWHHSPVAVEIERHLVRYFARAFGLPGDADGHFTSGGSEANQTAVLLALTDRVPGFARDGLHGQSKRPVFFASGESHHSLEKIAHQAGLGRDALVRVATRGDRGMDVSDLSQAVDRARDRGQQPFLVVATAGTTNAGVIDPLGEIAELCRSRNLHLHVDAAWGGSVILSRQLAPLLAGIEGADSITFDPHKLLSIPMGAGMILARDGSAFDRCFGIDAAYVPPSREAGMDNYRRSAQFSRRFIGLKLYMTLAAAGREGCAAAIERQVNLGRSLAGRLTGSGWRVVNQPRLALVCFDDPAWADRNREQRAALAEAVASHVVDSGEAWISTTRLEGEPVLRACITSYRTGEGDLDVLVRQLDQARRKLCPGEAAPAS